MKKLIVHIGYPKTATTSLQLNLFSSLMQEGKIEYLNHLNRKGFGLGDFYCKNILAYIVGTGDLNKCQDELNSLASITNEISLISNENLSIFCKGFTWSNFIPAAACNAKRIEEVFAPVFDEVTIIMTLRAQKTLTASFYAQIYRYIKPVNRTSTLTSWVNETFDLKIPDKELLFNFNQMYSSYSEIFGEENVKILLYEDLKYDKSNFYKQLSSLLCISPQKLETLLQTTVKNQTSNTTDNKLVAEAPTFSDVLLQYCRSPLKKVVPRKYVKFLGNTYRRSIGRMLSNFKVSKEITVENLTEAEMCFIQQRFKESNLLLAEKTNLDLGQLKQYGYLD